ncbi:MAG TPA: tetratricopeptide repeat protein [Candidatus Cloacimonadota bacterium]|nr:tetratricopeptide repeat protein [Candidatus Cloacimonadota bacterium]
MLNLIKPDRCKKCYSERALRMCPRLKKGLCWQCCNDLRIDLKCPSECPYTPVKNPDNPIMAFKADNQHESHDIMKRYLDIWIGQSNAALGGKSPLQKATEDKAGTLDWLSSYRYPPGFPINYLMQKLDIAFEDEQPHSDPESVATEYLNRLVTLEYNLLRELTGNDSVLADLDTRYEDIIKSIHLFRKMKQYNYIHTGLSEDGGQALVFVELNHKHECTIILRRANDAWIVRQSIMGNPSAYFTQNRLHQEIATYLGNAEDAKAWDKISSALPVYPDSADLYYYRGLYWLLVKQPDKAKVDLFSAIALDNHFPPPYMHLGLLYLQEKNYSEAELWYAALIQLEPDNPDAANNLAICKLALGHKEEALKIWNELLKQNPTYENARKNLELYG